MFWNWIFALSGKKGNRNAGSRYVRLEKPAGLYCVCVLTKSSRFFYYPGSHVEVLSNVPRWSQCGISWLCARMVFKAWKGRKAV